MPTAQEATRAEPAQPAGTPAPRDDSGVDSGRRPQRWLRWAAAGFGLAAAALAIVVPLLPVVAHEASISWPAGDRISDVSAPLTAYQPLRLHASVPCEQARQVRGTLFATVAPQSPLGRGLGMYLDSDGSRVVLTSRGRELGAAALPAGDCLIEIGSDATATTFAVGGAPVATVDEDVRPQVVGLYTDLTGARPDRLRLVVDVDNRFDTSPHALKAAAIVLVFLCAIASLLALHRLDRLDAPGPAPRLLPRRWWRPRLLDVVVVGVLAVWLLIGAITSDDGYLLTMARVREDAGYLGNYFRWLNVPEAPFGWFYELYALMVQVSTAPPWMRLPAFGLGVFSWWLISHAVLPRLGGAVRRSNAAGWAAAAVFLIFWLPYNNGLRPEPVAAAGSLLTLCLVERTVATRRLVPLGFALLVAALTVTATPTGVIALAPFLVTVRPLVATLRARARAGWLPATGPLAGCGLLVLAVVFADQSIAAVLEATRVRQLIGPSLSWFEEPMRYLQLLTTGVDGTLSRRFPVLVLLLCVGTCLVVLLRRGRIPGAALGPSWRLIGTAAVALAIIALTPTKWTHHFGAFAAIGGALAALTALATSGSVLRSRRNRAAFVSALLLLLAFSFTGSNGWWYVSSFGVPWFDRSPSVRGFESSTLLVLGAAVALVVAVVEHLRLPSPNGRAERPERPERRLRALRLGSAPLAVICGAIVLFEVLSLAKGMHKQRESYSLGAANVAALAGNECGLSDKVLVERDPAAGMLPVRSGLEPASLDGFEPGAVANGVENSDPGSRLPYGFGTGAAPVWGSVVEGRGTGELRTSWYLLPDRARTAPIVVTVGGLLGAGNEVRLEFGRRAGGVGNLANRVEPVEAIDLVDVEDFTEDTRGDWRDLQVMLGGRAEGADVVRLVAVDRNLTGDGWLAVAAPRIPEVTPLRQLVGPGERPSDPVYLQWPVAFAHPCLRPFGVHSGVAEVPTYLVSPDRFSEGGANGWAAPQVGGVQGPLDLLTVRHQLPAYLAGSWQGNWGKVYELEEFRAAPMVTVSGSDHVRSGLWSPGPMLVEVPPSQDSGTTR